MKPIFPVRHLKTIRSILTFAALLALLWRYHMPLMDAIHLLRDPQAIVDYLRGLGILGPIMLFLLLIAQVFLALIPGHALIMASGYIYGAPVTIAVVATSTILGSQLAFLLARKFGRPLIHKLASPSTIDRWNRVAGDRGGLFFFFTFVTPIFPADTMCYVAGLGKVSPKNFFAANFAGRLLGTVAMTLIGSYGFHPPLGFWLLFAGSLIALAVGWGFYNKSFKRIPTKSEFAYICGLAIMKVYATTFSLKQRVTGLENLPPGPKILAANHPNISDAFQLPLLLKEEVTILAQASQFQSFVLGWILTHSGQIPVPDGGDRKSFERACQALHDGKTVLIFPEGTVNPEGKGIKARSGAVRMSLATGAPIVPIGIHVAARDTINLRFSTGGKGHLGRWQFRGPFSAHIGRPWVPGCKISGDEKSADARELTRRLMTKIYALVSEAAKESAG